MMLGVELLMDVLENWEWRYVVSSHFGNLKKIMQKYELGAFQKHDFMHMACIILLAAQWKQIPVPTRFRNITQTRIKHLH